MEVGGFWIDRFEVTNRQFQAFLDAGGYRDRRYWKQPILEQGKALAWDDAMKAFHDRTGKPGPATWEGGHYPPDQGDYPVRGVSWYQAAAFAEFAGKEARGPPTGSGRRRSIRTSTSSR